jgi:hypothetical protein
LHRNVTQQVKLLMGLCNVTQQQQLLVGLCNVTQQQQLLVGLWASRNRKEGYLILKNSSLLDLLSKSLVLVVML